MKALDFFRDICYVKLADNLRKAIFAQLTGDRDSKLVD